MVVYYQPQQQSSWETRSTKKSPLKRFSTWAISKASATILEKPVKFFVGESLIGRLAAVVTVGLVIGALINLTIASVPFLGDTGTTLGTIITTPAFLGALAGAGAGGFAGAVVGAVWGWVIGAITDAITSELTSDKLANVLNSYAAWVAATILGLLAGKSAAWGFQKLADTRSVVARYVLRVFVVLALVAIGLVLLGVVKWLATLIS